MRRLFLTILGLVGLVLVILGSARMLEALWQLVFGQDGLIVQGDWLQRQVSDGLGMLLIGALMLHRSWQSWQLIIDQTPHEAATALRRFYLYAAVVISALAVLAPAAMLLRELLLMLFGSGDGSTAELLAKLGMPISFVPAGLIGWFWYRRYLRQEAERYGESAEAATIRRIYYYAVAATALVLFWLGLVEILERVAGCAPEPQRFAEQRANLGQSAGHRSQPDCGERPDLDATLAHGADRGAPDG